MVNCVNNAAAASSSSNSSYTVDKSVEMDAAMMNQGDLGSAVTNVVEEPIDRIINPGKTPELSGVDVK